VCGTLLAPANHIIAAALRASIAALIAARGRSDHELSPAEDYRAAL